MAYKKGVAFVWESLSENQFKALTNENIAVGKLINYPILNPKQCYSS
jgi:hypothetical protein